MLNTLLLAVEDLPAQALVHRKSRRGIAGLVLDGTLVLLEVLDEAGQSVLAPVEDQVFADLTLLGGNLRIGRNVGRVNDRRVEAGGHGVKEEDRVKRGAGVRGDAEAQITYAQGGEAAGDVGLHQTNALYRFDGSAAQFLLARGDRKGQHIED